MYFAKCFAVDRGSVLWANQGADSSVDEVDVTSAWEGFIKPGAQLVDVRTRAEWTYVGIPDLSSDRQAGCLVEWQTFPDQSVDPRFVERLAGELKALGVQAGGRPLFYLSFG